MSTCRTQYPLVDVSDQLLYIIINHYVWYSCIPMTDIWSMCCNSSTLLHVRLPSIWRVLNQDNPGQFLDTPCVISDIHEGPNFVYLNFRVDDTRVVWKTTRLLHTLVHKQTRKPTFQYSISTIVTFKRRGWRPPLYRIFSHPRGGIETSWISLNDRI